MKNLSNFLCQSLTANSAAAVDSCSELLVSPGTASALYLQNQLGQAVCNE